MPCDHRTVSNFSKPTSSQAQTFSIIFIEDDEQLRDTSEDKNYVLEPCENGIEMHIVLAYTSVTFYSNVCKGLI